MQCQAEQDAYERCGFTDMVYLVNPSCCPDCRKHDGRRFPLRKAEAGINAPPLHPNCQCFTAPAVSREQVEKDLGIDEISDEDVSYFDEWMADYEKTGITWNEWKDGKHSDIILPKSVGAKWSNYDVMDLETGDYYHFQEGSRITNVQVFAGKGVKTPYRNARNREKMAACYGGVPEDWKHVKGFVILETEDGPISVEVHWSECENYGKHEFFIKRYVDE